MNAVYKVIVSLPVIVAVFAGCSNSDKANDPGNQNTNSTTWDEVNKYWVSEIDASNAAKFVYYSFAARDIVGITEAAAPTSNDWDIAFSYLDIRTNSGESGNKEVVGLDLTALRDVDTLVFKLVSAADTIGISASQWTGDYIDYVINNYYRLGPGFQVQMTRYVYDMKDAIGRYFKLQFLGIVGGGAPPAMGTITFRYVYQPVAGNTDLSAAPDTFVVDGSGGTFYFDFSTGDTVRPANPATSTDWDLYVNHYTVQLNSGMFGPGIASGNPIFEDTGLTDSTDFEGYAVAAGVPQAYSPDRIASVFFKDRKWYDYSLATHEISSTEHTYLLKNSGKLYKLSIISWKGISGTESGKFVFYWAEL